MTGIGGHMSVPPRRLVPGLLYRLHTFMTSEEPQSPSRKASQPTEWRQHPTLARILQDEGVPSDYYAGTEIARKLKGLDAILGLAALIRDHVEEVVSGYEQVAKLDQAHRELLSVTQYLQDYMAVCLRAISTSIEDMEAVSECIEAELRQRIDVLKDNFKKRLTLGLDLLDRSIDTRTELEAAVVAFKQWRHGNVQMLTYFVGDSSIVQAYARSTPAEDLSEGGLQDDVSHYRQQIRTALEQLGTLQDELVRRFLPAPGS